MTTTPLIPTDQQLDEYDAQISAQTVTPDMARALLTEVRRLRSPLPLVLMTRDEETDEQRADREEAERLHADGRHDYCGVDCEAALPSEQLQNFIVAKGYPGTNGALRELLRRTHAQGAASVVQALDPDVLRERIAAAMAQEYTSPGPDELPADKRIDHGMMTHFRAEDGHPAMAPATPREAAVPAAAAVLQLLTTGQNGEQA